MSWEDNVHSLNVRRDGEGAISHITVTGVRERSGHYSRVEYDVVYRVDDDGCASLWQIQTDNKKVIAGHLLALLPIVERAISTIPDVQDIEALEDSIKRRRPNKVNQ